MEADRDSQFEEINLPPLPPHVRLIMSTLPQEKGKDLLSDLQKYSSKSNICFVEAGTLDFSRQDAAAAALDELVRCRPRKGNILPVKDTLSASHRQILLNACHAPGQQPTPLLVTLMLDIACSWPSYIDISKTAGITNSNGVRSLINFIFAEIKVTHGRLLVRRMLGMMTLAKEGLSEVELEDLLSLMDSGKGDLLETVYEWWVPLNQFADCPPCLSREF